jgi:RNA polymerase sigma-70 factor (ECF subfamily)
MAVQPLIADEQITTLAPRCQRGEPEALEALYDLYADRLYRYLLARTGEPDAAADLTTETFLRVLRSIGGFQLNRARPAASFSAWLYRIAGNLATDHLRSRRRTPTVELTDVLTPSPNLAPSRVAEERETLQALAQALTALSEDQRRVIVGKFGDELSNAELAAALGKTEGAVKALQHRALRTLGRLLGRGEG